MDINYCRSMAKIAAKNIKKHERIIADNPDDGFIVWYRTSLINEDRKVLNQMLRMVNDDVCGNAADSL